MRRLSCIPEAISQNHFHKDKDCVMAEAERRASQQEIDSALQFLERRQSQGSNGVLGNIQPDLYRKRGSMVKVSSSKDNICVGHVQLQLSYIFSKSDFVVVLLESSLNVQNEDCILTFSLDSQRRKDCSKIPSGSSIHMQNFKFPLSYQELMEKTLTVDLTVPNTNAVDGIQTLARASVPLTSINPSDELILFVELESVNDPVSYGEVQCCLQWLSSAERLTLSIQQATNICKKDTIGVFYFKASLLIGEKVIKKKKTGIQKGHKAPLTFNEALMFTVDHKQLAKYELELTLIEVDKNQEKPVAKVIFKNGTGPEGKTWKSALEGRAPPPLWFDLRVVNT